MTPGADAQLRRIYDFKSFIIADFNARLISNSYVHLRNVFILSLSIDTFV